MKSIVLCEPSYGDQSTEDKVSNQSKENGIKNAGTTEGSVKKDDSLTDIEICLVGNAVSVGEKTDMRKDETIKAEEKEAADEGSIDAVGESVEPDGAGDTSKDDEDIEIISCVVKEGSSERVAETSVKEENLGQFEEGVVKDADPSSNCDVTPDGCEKENGVSDSERGEGSEKGGAEAEESDRAITEVNPWRESNECQVKDEEKIEDEFDAEEAESNSRGKQSSDEGFIEEEENKENRSGDAECGGATPVVECVESAWDADKTELFESKCSGESDMDVDLIEGGKSEEDNVSEEVHSTEKTPDVKTEDAECEEKPEEVAKAEEVVAPKRKRRSLDGRELVKASVKKRRTRRYDSTGSEVQTRHSRGAKSTDDVGSTSCHDSGDNEKEGKLETEGDAQKNTLEESIDRVASAQITLPFLESLRGTITSLSRSDLEELIVQKFCEVITERSTIGVLRKKALALEQDQERWKEKVHTLTKQLREMDMVMKKYMSEVQKQAKNRNFQMVTPLRVTRSVGLQVSFGSSNAKPCKVVSNNSQARQPPPEVDKAVKQPPQLPPEVSAHVQAKKSSPVVLRKKAEQKKPFSPRVGVNVTFQARLVSPQSVLTPNGALQQVNAMNRPRLPAADESSSKIIDLTDDDDRQNSHTTPKTVFQPGVTVKPPGQLRVVNHIQPAQMNAGGGRVAYLVPATTATASGSTVPPPSRQLLIATPTVQQQPRQLLPSVPPLLYKGSTILQPGAQRPSLLNQPNRALMPKPLQHPAPLPQPPPNQIQKPNLKLLPPRPALKISKVQTGIVLSWNMVLGPEYEPIASYQLYAYQENNSPPATSLWKKVGDVKALPLPMACTLTQFMSGHKYYFAVRAVDHHSRIGPFSFPGSIVLIK